MPRGDQTLTLVCHPETPVPAVTGVAVRLRRTPDGGLSLSYQLSGDMGRLRIPVPKPPGPTDELWQHTCFEVFIANSGEAAYREFNFSPSGQWAAYAFFDYRQRDLDGGSFGSSISPQIATRLSPGQLELNAVLAAGALPPQTGTLDLGLSAVVETIDGSLAYWALRHTTSRPDFHHRASFTFELADGEPPA